MMNEFKKLNPDFFLLLDHTGSEEWDKYRTQMKVSYDSYGQNNDLVAFTFSQNGKEIAMQGLEVTGNGEEYFYLDKMQLDFLINFLTQMRDNMEYSGHK